MAFWAMSQRNELNRAQENKYDSDSCHVTLNTLNDNISNGASTILTTAADVVEAVGAVTDTDEGLRRRGRSEVPLLSVHG